MDYICAHLSNITSQTTQIPYVPNILQALAAGPANQRKLLEVQYADNEDISGDILRDISRDKSSDNSSNATVEPSVYDASAESVDASNETSNPVDLVKTILSRHYDDFHLYSEVYVMTAIAILGLILNALAIFTLHRDVTTPKRSRIFLGVYIAGDQLFLALTLVFIQLRKYLPRDEQQHRIEMMNIFTACLLFVVCAQPWILYAVASHTRAALKRVRGVRLNQLTTPANLLMAAPPVFMYCAFYTPWVRLFLHERLPRGRYSLCNVPMENHWNLDTKDVLPGDGFYVVVYCLIYVILAYIVPFFMVASRDKFIIDSLQALQKDPDRLMQAEGTACIALVVSVTCNVHLVCVTIKMALLSFYVFDFLIGYIVSAAVFFQYLNVFGNLLLVFKSSVHLIVILLYHWNVRDAVVNRLTEMKEAVMEKIRCVKCASLIRERLHSRSHQSYRSATTESHLDGVETIIGTEV